MNRTTLVAALAALLLFGNLACQTDRTRESWDICHKFLRKWAKKRGFQQKFSQGSYAAKEVKKLSKTRYEVRSRGLVADGGVLKFHCVIRLKGKMWRAEKFDVEHVPVIDSSGP